MKNPSEEGQGNEWNQVGEGALGQKGQAQADSQQEAPQSPIGGGRQLNQFIEGDQRESEKEKKRHVGHRQASVKLDLHNRQPDQRGDQSRPLHSSAL